MNRIVAVSGMSRTGSTYFMHVFFLHPRLRGIAHVSVHVLSSLMSREKVDYKRLYSSCKEQDWSVFWDLGRMDGIEEFEEYHEYQNTKSDFDGVCFKNDFGERWYGTHLHRLTDRVLCIYCVRTNIADLWRSWKTWGIAKPLPAAEFVKYFGESVEGAYVLKRQGEQGIIDFEAVTINSPHEKIRERIVGISNKYLGYVGEWQLKFLEKRRPLSVGKKGCISESDEELMTELYQADPKLDSLIDKYKSLVRVGT